MKFATLPEQGIEVMLDLETMGTDRYSPVIAIGAVRFNLGQTGPYEPFYQAITLESCMEVGLRPSASTIKWWMVQSKEAQKLFTDESAVALPLALDAFTDWMNSRPDCMWGNSAAFDLGLLADAYKACGKEVPWQFYRERCYRTLKNLPGLEHIPLKRVGTHHNALDDAMSQAIHCRDILAYLAKRQGTAKVQMQAKVGTLDDILTAQESPGGKLVEYPEDRVGLGLDPLQT